MMQKSSHAHQRGQLHCYGSMLEIETMDEGLAAVNACLPRAKGGVHLATVWGDKDWEYKYQLRRRLKEIKKNVERKVEKKDVKMMQPALKTREELAPGILQIFRRSVSRRATVEKMWNDLKANEQKKLKPIILHACKLDQLASPSTKQCLEIYQNPTAHDRFTGKPIPLGEVLNEVKRKHPRNIMAIINSAISENLKDTKEKAEIMMRQRDLYDNRMTKEVRLDWYFTDLIESRADLHTSSTLRRCGTTPSSATKTTRSTPLPLRLKGSEETLSALKKQLPRYLTTSGSVLSASLEVDDDKQLYCVPCHRTKSSSAFSTEEAEKRIQSTNTELSVAKSSSSYISKEADGCWQPLTTAALLEHSRVSEIPVKRRHGHKEHGHYHMWRPQSSHSHLTSS